MLIMRWVLLIIWSGFVLAMSIMPSDNIPEVSAPHADLLVHLMMYLVMGVLLGPVLSVYRWSGSYGKCLLFTLIFGGGYGILMELLQVFIPGRDPSLLDTVLNLIGAFLGFFINCHVFKRLKWRK